MLKSGGEFLAKLWAHLFEKSPLNQAIVRTTKERQKEEEDSQKAINGSLLAI